jgi:ribosomal protein S18 acetylase RimI-like enzyme
MSAPVTFRTATEADVEQLIDLMVISSWGGIQNAWKNSARAGESWQDRARAELSDPACEIGYTRFLLAECDSSIAGMMLLNAMGSTDMLSVQSSPPEYASAIYLMKEARYSLFIRELAVQEWARGQGLATEFLTIAARVAQRQDISRVTLIVNDANGPAHKLYLKHGYEQVAEAVSTGHPKFGDGSMLLLLEKKLTG